MKSYLGIIIFLTLILIGFLLMRAFPEKKKIDWTETYSFDKSTPFGCELLYKNL